MCVDMSIRVDTVSALDRQTDGLSDCRTGEWIIKSNRFQCRWTHSTDPSARGHSPVHHLEGCGWRGRRYFCFLAPRLYGASPCGHAPAPWSTGTCGSCWTTPEERWKRVRGVSLHAPLRIANLYTLRTVKGVIDNCNFLQQLLLHRMHRK